MRKLFSIVLLVTAVGTQTANAQRQPRLGSTGQVKSDSESTMVALGTGPCTDDTWATTTTITPNARYGHTAVWTGTEMIIWGGADRVGGSNLNTGGRYDPANDIWTAVSTDGAPSARVGHTAIWTGTEMIIWGGEGVGALNTGSRYNPVTDSWMDTRLDGAPSARYQHTAIWTGAEMIVWGGWIAFGSFLNTGSRYDPITDTWTAINTASAPIGRADHTAVWTGMEMIVWGGTNGSPLGTGSRYDPIKDTWTATSMLGAPGARWLHTGVWTHMEMILWGGQYQYYDKDLMEYVTVSLGDGRRYDPATDTWSATSNASVPSARGFHTAVWTGTEMIVWGGFRIPFSPFNSGGRYNPATDTWAATSTNGAPTARYRQVAVWTDAEMIVWGGSGDGLGSLNTGSRYCATSGAPNSR
jgi:N-acetylneuraminic acid mutarotase